MEGIFFLLSVIGVGLIMWWVIQNDRVGPTEPTTGLFAMEAGEMSATKEMTMARIDRRSAQQVPRRIGTAERDGRRSRHLQAPPE